MQRQQKPIGRVVSVMMTRSPASTPRSGTDGGGRRLAAAAPVAALAASLVVALSATAAWAAPSPGTPAPLVASDGLQAIPGRYVVVLRATPSGRNAGRPALAADRARARGVRVDRVYSHALNGFAATLSPAQLATVRADPDVAYVAPDGPVRATDVQSPASWGLDRIDQPGLPLSGTYVTDATGAGVTVFIVDSGMRASHSQFAGRVAAGADFVGDGNGTNDCNGHGTHVAGTAGGSTLGVAPAVTLVPVRVLDCSGIGTLSGLVAGVDWVTAHRSGPSVANVSVTANRAYQPLDDAIKNSVDSGVVVVVSAGNKNADACTESPARSPAAITVAASTRTDSRDTSYSNFGPCVSLFAPGTDITSAGTASDTATQTMKGTSMAAPHVAGAAALYLQNEPDAAPVVIKNRIINDAAPDVLTNIGPGSPNRLLYSVPAASSARVVASGDYNGDRRADLALTPGPNTPWWFTQPIAFSNGDGTFRITNTANLGDWPKWAQVPGVKVASGDFNGDGRTDLTLTPGANTPWWFTQPVAFSNGDGTFRITNTADLGDWPKWAQAPGVRLTTGDFNGDGRTDLTLTPGPNTPWWFTQPIAFSNGDGTFRITNTANLGDWPKWAQVPGVKVASGDFNGDGRTDLALVPGPNMSWWFTQPVAFSNGDGTFRITNTADLGDWPKWAQVPGVKVASGDFNADGRTDLTLTPGPNTPWWFTQPTAFSNGDGTFRITNTPDVGDWPKWAQASGVRIVGDKATTQ